MFTFYNEMIKGNTILRAFGKQEESLELYYDLMDNHQHIQHCNHSIHRWNGFSHTYRNISMTLISGLICVLLRNQLSTFVLYLMFDRIRHFQHKAGWFNGQQEWWKRESQNAQKFLKFYNELPQEKTLEETEDAIKELPASWPQAGQIEFENVELRYRPECEKVLKGLSFKIESGHKVGIVGRTGAGKSTIGLTLSRIVEICGGSIKIDGVDISKIDINELRKHVTVIS